MQEWSLAFGKLKFFLFHKCSVIISYIECNGALDVSLNGELFITQLVLTVQYNFYWLIRGRT